MSGLRPSPRRHVVVLGSVLAALLVSGCASSASDERLTVDEYQTRLAEIREDYAATYDRLSEADFGAKRLDELFLACNELGEIMNDLTSRLQALSPPEQSEPGHTSLVAGLLAFKSFFHDFAAQIDASSAVRAQRLVDVSFPGGKIDLSRVAAARAIDDALAELEAAE